MLSRWEMGSVSHTITPFIFLAFSWARWRTRTNRSAPLPPPPTCEFSTSGTNVSLTPAPLRSGLPRVHRAGLELVGCTRWGDDEVECWTRSGLGWPGGRVGSWP